MSENYIVINGKRAELTREQLEQLGIKKESNKRWRAAKECRYWFAHSVMYVGYAADSYIDSNSQINNTHYYTHNYFQTREEAQKYADVLNTEMRLRKYADEHNGDFNNGYRRLCGFISEEGKPEMDSIWEKDSELIPRCIKFSDTTVIDGAVKEIGKDKVIEYLTYEW